MITRRRFVQTLGAVSGASLLPTLATANATRLTRTIPSSGEALPVIGMGSSRTFDVELTDKMRAQLGEVLKLFFEGGGTLIDSSPMYGNAESVLGELLRSTPGKERLFAATKVWTNGERQGIEQMNRSMQRMEVARFDLMQIHNLRDWETHLRTLREWKDSGRIRYLGITTSHGRSHDALVDILKREPFDFVQLSYSIGNRDVEQNLLPVAQDRGIAVLVNRPFQRGSLFRRVKGVALPAFAQDLDIASWGQFFLKYAVSHPSVTCAIPATSKPHHMKDNMLAGFGAMPDAASRRRMEEAFQRI